jgi:hypothetical protein
VSVSSVAAAAVAAPACRSLLRQQPHLLLHLQQLASTWPAWQSYLGSVGHEVLQELLLQMTKPDRVLRLQLVVRWV